MIRDSLKEKLDSGSMAFGTIALDPYSIEVIAYMGFDWVLIDQMSTGLDWTATETLIRCSEAAGITPIVRVQSNPWLGYDHHIAVDVTRLISIGAQYIQVSNSCKREIIECLEGAKNWHRKYWVHTYSDDWEPRTAEIASAIQIIPQPECKEGLEDLLETLDLPGVRIAFVGTTDPSKLLGKSVTPNFYNKDLWELIDKVVAKANTKGAVLIANTSFCRDMDDMKARVLHMHKHGIRMPMLQNSYYLFQLAIGKLLREVKSAL